MKLIVISSALLFACASAKDSGGGGGGPSSSSAASGSSGTAVTDSDSAKAAVGKTVQVAGTALNAKLGPVVTTGGLVIYCMGRQEWRADQVGTKVVVTGTLEQTDEYKAEVGPNGEHSAGTGGNDFVIRDCKVDEGAPAATESGDQGGGGGW